MNINSISKPKVINSVDNTSITEKEVSDITMDHAQEKYNLIFWKERVKIIDERIIKTIVEGIFKSEARKNPDSIKEICYVLIKKPYSGLDDIFTNTDNILFEIFMRPEDDTRNIESYTLEDKIVAPLTNSNSEEINYHNNAFNSSLGHYVFIFDKVYKRVMSHC